MHRHSLLVPFASALKGPCPDRASSSTPPLRPQFGSLLPRASLSTPQPQRSRFRSLLPAPHPQKTRRTSARRSNLHLFGNMYFKIGRKLLRWFSTPLASRTKMKTTALLPRAIIRVVPCQCGVLAKMRVMCVHEETPHRMQRNWVDSGLALEKP